MSNYDYRNAINRRQRAIARLLRRYLPSGADTPPELAYERKLVSVQVEGLTYEYEIEYGGPGGFRMWMHTLGEEPL